MWPDDYESMHRPPEDGWSRDPLGCTEEERERQLYDWARLQERLTEEAEQSCDCEFCR